MNARFFAGPDDGRWISINPLPGPHLVISVADSGELHRYYRFGDRLIWQGLNPVQPKQVR